MKNIFVFVMILSSLTLFSQQEKKQDSILTHYITGLKLNDIQAKEFTVIYNKYKESISKEESDDSAFNKIIKLRDLEIYKMLTKEQFSVYKKLKKEIEPQLKYRWN